MHGHISAARGLIACGPAAGIAAVLFPALALAFPGTTMSWAYSGSQDGEALGTSIANVGDLNGDGYDDVAAGAPSYNANTPDHGRVHVFYGSATGLPAQPSWTVVGSVRDGLFGGSVAGAGDVNGDGYDDLIVGAQDHDGGSGDAGAVFLYYGSAGGLATEPAWTAFGEDSNDQFGCAVAGAGDVNGDGYDDVLVGSYRWMDTLVRQGKASLFLGGPGGPEVTIGSLGLDQAYVPLVPYSGVPILLAAGAVQDEAVVDPGQPRGRARPHDEPLRHL